MGGIKITDALLPRHILDLPLNGKYYFELVLTQGHLLVPFFRAEELGIHIAQLGSPVHCTLYETELPF